MCIHLSLCIHRPSCTHSVDPDNCGFDIFADVPDCINAAVVVTIPTNDYSEPMSSANVPTTPPTAESQKITTAISSNNNDNSKVTSKRDSNANDIMLSPNLMRPAPANPNNRFMNSVTAVYKSLSSCKVRLSNIESVSAQKAAAAAAVQADAAAAAAAASATVASPSTPTTTTTKSALRNSIESDDGNNSVAAVGLDDYETEIGGCVGELFEFEESEAPHVPLYTLRDEGAVKWAMLTDLCGMLKVKSKDTLLKQVHLPLFTV